MLQQDKPEDFVIATGKQYSVREFVEKVSKKMGINIEWTGTGVNEKGIDSDSGKEIIIVDKKYFRPTEVETLLGDASKASKELGWEPKITLEEGIRRTLKDFSKGI